MRGEQSESRQAPLPAFSGAKRLQALLGGKKSQLSLAIVNLLLPLAGQYENLGKYQPYKESIPVMLLHLKVKSDSFFLFLEKSRLLLTLRAARVKQQ